MGMLLSDASGASSVLDTGVVTFIIDAAKQLIGILTTPPLGVFLTIGIIGAVAGLVGTIVMLVRRR